MQNPLRTWREVYGLSRARAAQALSISYSHLAHLESDYNENLGLRVLDGLAAAGVNPLEFRVLWAKYMAQRRREALAEVRP